MTIRLPRVTALLLLPLLIPLLALLALPGTVRAQAPDGTGPASAAPHRFFFANAQRESLTGTRDARIRMHRMVTALHRTDVDLGVLVELQGNQPRYFDEAAGSEWGMITGRHGVRDSVIYRRDVWTPLSRSTLATFWTGGRRQRTPVVVLADRRGTTVAVIPVHNPYDDDRLSRTNNRRILATVDALQDRGVPVLVAGDFNSGDGARCLYTRQPHRLRSAGHTGGAPCRRGREARIDQAFATPDLELGHYRERYSRATDHRYVYTVAFGPAQE